MNKPIMDIFGETPYKWWMGVLTVLNCTNDKCDTIKRQRIEDDKREFNFRVKKTNRGYVLAEGKVDAASASANQSVVTNTTSVTATSESPRVVERAFTGTDKEA